MLAADTAAAAGNMWTAIGTGITTLGLVLVAGLQVRRHQRQTAELSDRIGQPNGNGNLVTMVESILRGQGRIEARLDSLEEWRRTEESPGRHRR